MKLLLAEDNPKLSRPTKVILTRSGYDVDTAFDGEEALEKLHTSEYDGLVLDIMVPKIDGRAQDAVQEGFSLEQRAPEKRAQTLCRRDSID